jgi:hypothetical protein
MNTMILIRFGDNVLDKRVDQTSELTKNLNYLNKNRHKTTTNYLIN